MALNFSFHLGGQFQTPLSQRTIDVSTSDCTDQLDPAPASAESLLHLVLGSLLHQEPLWNDTL